MHGRPERNGGRPLRIAPVRRARSQEVSYFFFLAAFFVDFLAAFFVAFFLAAFFFAIPNHLLESFVCAAISGSLAASLSAAAGFAARTASVAHRPSDARGLTAASAPAVP